MRKYPVSVFFSFSSFFLTYFKDVFWLGVGVTSRFIFKSGTKKIKINFYIVKHFFLYFFFNFYIENTNNKKLLEKKKSDKPQLITHTHIYIK